MRSSYASLLTAPLDLMQWWGSHDKRDCGVYQSQKGKVLENCRVVQGTVLYVLCSVPEQLRTPAAQKHPRFSEFISSFFFFFLLFPLPFSLAYYHLRPHLSMATTQLTFRS